MITADKWLVGNRFAFEALMPVTGEEGERIHAMIWRVEGEPPVGGFDSAMVDVELHWTGEDACADNPPACVALLAALDEDGEEEDL